MSYVIGVDSSTTATKAVVWNREGRAVADGRAEFSLALPRPGWHEQDAEDWWRSTARAVRSALRSVDAPEVEAICITHQRETFACLDEDGRAVRPAIVWMDVRATREVEHLGSDEVHRLTGKPADTTPALYKLLWLCEHEPETIKRTRWVADVHAFLVNRLTGTFRTTTACADPLGLIDMDRRDWSDDLLTRVGLTRERVPTLFSPGDVVGELSDAASEQLGLPAGLPVVGGAGDGQSAGLGANATRPGSAYLNLGTAVVAGSMSERYAWDRAFRTLIGAVPGTYAMETLLQGGTYTVNWFLARIAALDAGRLGLGLQDVDLLEAAAARLAPSAGGDGTRPRATARSAADNGRRVAQQAVARDPGRRDGQDRRRLSRGRDDQPRCGHSRRRRRRLARLAARGRRRDDGHGRPPRPQRGHGGALRRALRDLSRDLSAHCSTAPGAAAGVRRLAGRPRR